LLKRFLKLAHCSVAVGRFGNIFSGLLMNWDESKACTPIKRDFLRAWFEVDQRFFLTGGSALGLFYLHHRISYDLDLFTTCGRGGRDRHFPPSLDKPES
jgi:hypothetical protein